MIIVSDQTRTVFYLPDFAKAKRLGTLLGMLDLKRKNLSLAMRNKRAVRRAAPPKKAPDLTGKEDYAKVAIVADPVLALVDNWRSGFKKRRTRLPCDTDELEKLGLSSQPELSSFLVDFDTYSRVAPDAAQFVDIQRKTLGDDLGAYDHVLRLDREGELEAYLKSVTAKTLPVGLLTMDTQLPELLSEKALEALRMLTAGDYDLLKGRYDFDASEIHQIVWSSSDEPKDIRTIVRHDSPPLDWFHVVIIIQETPEVVRRFVNYYAAIGARMIHMYFDDPEDPSIEMVRDHPQVNAIRCDAEFWQGKRRGTFEGRQSMVYTRTYSQLEKGCWLLAVDADEFVASGKPLHDLFLNAPEDLRIIRFTSHEAIWTEDQDVTEAFSANHVRRRMMIPGWSEIRPFKKPELRDMFRKGILSHRSGKYAVRSGLEVDRLATHQVLFPDGYSGMRPPGNYKAGILVHFDAISYQHWETKFLRRLNHKHGFAGFGPGRKEQHDYLRQLDPKDYPAFHADLYKVPADEMKMMAHIGLVSRLEIFEGLPDSVGAIANSEES